MTALDMQKKIWDQLLLLVTCYTWKEIRKWSCSGGIALFLCVIFNYLYVMQLHTVPLLHFVSESTIAFTPLQLSESFNSVCFSMSYLFNKKTFKSKLSWIRYLKHSWTGLKMHCESWKHDWFSEFMKSWHFRDTWSRCYDKFGMII